jgi:hypothetical protein
MWVDATSGTGVPPAVERVSRAMRNMGFQPMPVTLATPGNPIFHNTDLLNL